MTLISSVTFRLLLAAMILATSLLTANCGGSGAEDDGTDGLAADQAAPADGDRSTDGPLFRGYVASAFEVTVDEAPYQDMEDFYTQELDRLPEKVRAAGYTEDYDIHLEAELGFTDLWNDMTVFIAPVNTRGYQGEGRVGRGGEFSISLPADANDTEYKVRANKRINIVLTRNGEVTRICYNFSAVDRSVLFSDKEKPIILDKFTTTLTKYACDTSSRGGIVVPGADDAATFPRGKISKGMSKEEVLAVTGQEGLTVASPTKWCWRGPDGGGAAPLCDQNYYGSCQCSVTFDAEGRVEATSNTKSDHTDILSF